MVRGEPHAPVVPRRLGVPLVEEIQVVDADRAREAEPDRGIAPELERGRRVEHVRDVDLAVLQHRGPRGGVRDRLEHQPLHRWHLAPVTFEGFHHQLHAGRVAHELVGPEPDGLFLEALVADLLDVLPGHDPARAGRQRSVERHEVGERLVEMEAHARGADHLDLPHPVLEDLADLGPLEAELHVVGGEGVAVVELQALAQLELVDTLIRAHRPRLRQARRHEIARHRLHQRVVQGVEHPERREEARGDLARIEPGRRQGHVQRPAHLAFRLRRRRPGLSPGVGHEGGHDHDGDHEALHASLSYRCSRVRGARPTAGSPCLRLRTW